MTSRPLLPVIMGCMATGGWRTANTGTGPGVITPDGCAVEFYALHPPGREPEIVHAAAGSADGSILELGAGTGRIADVLAGMGHDVVAVDESPDMLARVRRAETVCAAIQDLDLGRRFDLVLLASFLVNAADDATRSAFLATCARHVSQTGCVVIQRHPSAWFASVRAFEREEAGIIYRMRDVTRPGPGLVSATVEYQAGDRVWTQSFTTMMLGDEELPSVLGSAGLAVDSWLTDDGQWVRTVPLQASGRR
jgi:SAM-dependent methyltransferase